MKTEVEWLAEPCYCGHSRQGHRSRPGGPTVRCATCTDGHYFQKPELHERLVREAAVAADPAHTHDRTHTAYACPGFRAFQVCDDCGQALRPAWSESEEQFENPRFGETRP